jgi:hypothetical protein
MVACQATYVRSQPKPYRPELHANDIPQETVGPFGVVVMNRRIWNDRLERWIGASPCSSNSGTV